MSEDATSLPDHWIEAVIEDHIDFIDYRGKTPEKIESGMRLITAKNVKKGFLQLEPREFVDPAIYEDWMTRGIPNKGDVLFTTEAPLGNVAQLDTDEKVVFAQRIIIMQPDPEVLDSTFVKYMLLSGFMQRRIQDKGTGATAKGIKSKLLKKIPLAFPDTVAEQKRIVSILDEAFSAIAKAKENAEKNLANARELFESYLNRVFTQQGPGWQEPEIQEHIEFIDYRGKTPKKIESGMRLITAKNVKKGFLQLKPQEFVDPAIYDEWMTRGIPQKGDVLFTTEAPLGNVAQLDTADKVVFAQRIIIMQPDHEKIDPTFLKFALLSSAMQQRIQDRGTGATAKGIKSKLLKQVPIPFPGSLKEQREHVEVFESLWATRNRLETIYTKKLANLDELKQSLLQKAFTGQLTTQLAEAAL